MVRTRVGYTGGDSPNPTYYSLGDHSEAIQVDFDPKKVSYDQLLGLAQKLGRFQGDSWSRQYRSAVFYHNETQREAAKAQGISQLEALKSFTRAEDYHQKYYLQQSGVVKDFYSRYPTAEAFTDSLAVTKANGIVGGYVDSERLQGLVPEFGVSEKSASELLSMKGRSIRGCSLPKPEI